MYNTKNLYWFDQVYWDARGIVIECLVEIREQNPISEGYWLIREDQSLKLKHFREYESEHIQRTNILGKAIKWDKALNKKRS